ncbi:MAG: hypothetical protein F6K23_35955 [Okeania sp. SIO2C9]|uniref:hypothetical protein n=1 Tax=Okeania sp. SIO2C9 TaxID=2607791 RepID=UPI0013BF8F1D|nr:hypothetical protein [Okeania sp. SIO2C9]NEQ77933.1 hypothetical protein [Okeania sp. SIO2C9]
MTQQQIATSPGLLEQLQELLQHPDFGFDVEVEKLPDAIIYTFDTERSNFDLILESQSATLFQYDFMQSPDGEIDDFDVEFTQAHQIESVQQFLNLLK